MSSDFPGFNMIPFRFLKKRILEGMLSAVLLTDGEQVYGYTVYHFIDDLAITHAMYLAILPGYRSAGLGSRLMELLRGLNRDYQMLLEIDRPDGVPGSEKERRVGFYERSGYRVIHGLVVYMFTLPTWVMTDGPEINTDWEKLYKNLYVEVFGSRMCLPFISVAHETEHK